MASRIEWLRDAVTGKPGHTINPVKGLCPVDCRDMTGKPYCYARKMYRRFGWQEKVRWFPPAWDLVDTLKRPSRIFVGSTFELFHSTLPENWMEYNLLTAQKYPQHTFIFLTKRPENLAKWSPFPDNCHVGVSCTSSNDFWDRSYNLRHIKATVKFISFEPFLSWRHREWAQGGSWNLSNMLIKDDISWVIVGQQTPVKASTQPRIEWITEIEDACNKAGIPYFEKNNLAGLLKRDLVQSFPPRGR